MCREGHLEVRYSVGEECPACRLAVVKQQLKADLDAPLCGEHAAVWFTARNTLKPKSGCVFCDYERRLSDATAKLAEWTTPMSCGHPRAALDDSDDSCLACDEKTQTMSAYPFHVYPGSEKMDLGPKGEPQVLCQNRSQAEHMAKFWGEAGYVEAASVGKCPKCDGCGQVANTPDQEPWTVWMALPLQSAGAVVAGLVKPIPCPKCGGKAERD
jgi:hypothetical protein